MRFDYIKLLEEIVNNALSYSKFYYYLITKTKQI